MSIYFGASYLLGDYYVKKQWRALRLLYSNGFFTECFLEWKETDENKIKLILSIMLLFTDSLHLGKRVSLYSIWVMLSCILSTTILSFCLYSHHVAITLLFSNFDFCMIGKIFIVTVHAYGCFSYLKDRHAWKSYRIISLSTQF